MLRCNETLCVVPQQNQEGSKITNPGQTALCAKLLALDANNLQRELCYRCVTIRGSMSTIPLKQSDAMEARDAVAKVNPSLSTSLLTSWLQALYGSLFDWLIKRINK